VIYFVVVVVVVVVSTLDNSELGKQALLAIKELVKSDSEYERNQGVQWMFNLCIVI